MMDSDDGPTRDNIVTEGKGPECARFLFYHTDNINTYQDESELDMKARIDRCEKQIKFFLSYEGTKDYTNEKGDTLLHRINHGTPLSTIKLLVESGVPKDTQNTSGYTPLARAIYLKNVAAAKYLISLNVNVNLHTHHISSLPHMACRDGSLEILKLLVEAKADLSATNHKFGESLLYTALGEFNTPPCVDLVEYLVDELGFDVNARGGRSRYPIIRAASKCRNANSIEIQTLKFLISRKADLNIADDQGRRAVHIAAISYWSDCLEALVEAGADINAEDQYGRRPIHFAAGHSPRCIEYLLKQRVDADVQDHDGWTPLMWAARSGDMWVMTRLVKNGADLWTRGRSYDSEWSALKLARFWNEFRYNDESEVTELLTPEILSREIDDGRTEEWDEDFHKVLPSHRKLSECESCLMVIIGFEWRCIECHDEGICLCFKCYSHRSTLHNPEHNFEKIGPPTAEWLTSPEENSISDHEFSEDESIRSVEEAPEIDEESIVEVEDYDDCDVSVFDNESINDDTEWMMLYHERTIKI
ncbi:ankyrin repeat-containing domain protein [Annulohypoxylon bovei var. microspora]|nr:ankyrin repeat-containing domain protein [Annulohypoxylon bovei var. microspora]